MENKSERCLEIEKSIVTTFRKQIWLKFIDGINEFKMVNNPTINVGIIKNILR